jgi:hypothetical protein
MPDVTLREPPPDLSCSLMAKTPQRVDTGSDFPDTSEDPVGEYVVVGPIWGKDWRILTGVNLFSALNAEMNPSEYALMISDAIHPDDRVEFLAKLRKQRNLDDPMELMKLVNTILGAASGNPTTSSGVSSATTPRKAAASRSGAR